MRRALGIIFDVSVAILLCWGVLAMFVWIGSL